ncbi:MAG: KOW motif-containing protein, partial [Gemmatimonadetes bacterium]|nr:KOW motif-containing protein [Gemmatimonadota bacterium]
MMGKMILRKGDHVKVLRGNERGKEGTILRV